MSKFIDRGDVHYRIAGLTLADARVACVQDFDYYDYEGFLIEDLFETEVEAENWLTVYKVQMRATGLTAEQEVGLLMLVIENMKDQIKELEDR